MYKLDGTRLLIKRRVPCTWRDAKALALRALGKKRARLFLTQLSNDGEATARRQVVSYKVKDEDNWAQLQGREVNGEFRFYCSGPEAVGLVRRANLRKSWEERRTQAEAAYTQRRKKLRKKKRQQKLQTPKKPKARRREDLTPQFRNGSVDWDFCIELVEQLCGVERDSKYTARQLAARALYRSVEKTDWQWAYYKYQ